LFAFMLFFSARAATAQPPALPQLLEFRFEPSFGEGTCIWLKRMPDGKIDCSVDSIPAQTDPRGLKQNKLPKKVEVSAADFRMLAVEIEGTTLREE